MEKRPVDVVVISDVHLGTYGCKAKELTQYLKSIAPQMLILNGDIIDGWQFSKRYFPSTHLSVIKELVNMVSRGTRMVYITGNHDEMLRRYSGLELGNFQLTDKLVIEINNKMTWIFHGDVFDHTNQGAARIIAKLGSFGYGLLIQLNRFTNFVLKLFGKKKVSFSKRIMQGVNKAIVKMHAFEQTTASIAIDKGYDFVVCGHIHQPEKKRIENHKGAVTYLNSGDWVEHLTALEYHHQDWHVYTYRAENFIEQQDETTPVTLSVVTDEVHFYINALAI
jgi:UDP-2,3-diacylglucosamine pyrophosphatase LpxH